MSLFKKATAVWAKSYDDDLNVSLFFKIKLNCKNKCKLIIAANNFYRIYVNGQFKGYGPARAAHNFYRIDNYILNECLDTIIVIEVSGYNCNSFYALNTKPFFCCEIYDGDKVIATSEDFECFLNETRYQKVVRFSYQRAFSESYKIDGNYIPFLKNDTSTYKKLFIKKVNVNNYLRRKVKYCTFKRNILKHCETGLFSVNKNAKIYDDRYMNLECLKIFKRNDYDINSNEIASQLECTSNQNLVKLLKDGMFNTYELSGSHTGFINLNVDVKKKTTIYILFDEIDTNESINENIGIKFYRNTTHNVVTYELDYGKYNLITFEPYTIKYLRIFVLEGEVHIENVKVIDYVNPDARRIKFSFSDEKINTIFKAAISTFEQNAVDILTDCPSRERAGWLCDAFFSAKAEKLICGNNKVEDNFLENFEMFNSVSVPKGMIPMCYPADFSEKMFIPNWAMWYVLEIYDNYLRTGRTKNIRKSKKIIYDLLNYFKGFENEFGLLENLDGWIFVEWSQANSDEFIKGVNFPTNMIYAETLEKAGIIYKDKNLIKRGELLKQKINELSFNGKFYCDNAVRNSLNILKSTTNFTETCQYYAFFTNVANPEKKESLYDTLIKDFGPNRDYKKIYPDVYKSNAFIGDFLRLDLFAKTNKLDLLRNETIDYLYKMAVKTGTLWENDSIYGSLNHCFESYSVNLILNMTIGLDRIEGKNIYFNKSKLNIPCEVKIPLGAKKFLCVKSDGINININCDKSFNIIWK